MKIVGERLPALAPKLLIAAPQLAAIALLDRALAVAVNALLAEHPALAAPPTAERTEPSTLEHARQLLGLARPLRPVLSHYRIAVRATLLSPPSGDDLPF